MALALIQRENAAFFFVLLITYIFIFIMKKIHMRHRTINIIIKLYNIIVLPVII